MTNVYGKFLNNQKKSFFLFLLNVMMEKINQQDVLIKELTTRVTQQESCDLLKNEDSKCS